MRIGYADPPYPGQSAKHYADHPDYAGEVDHGLLLTRLDSEFDGWVLHTHVPALTVLLPICPPDVRVLAWVKPFAAFKRNVPVAYAWEPVIVKAARKPVVGRTTFPLRDWLAEPITMRRGLAGAKPRLVCWWCFECVGADVDDDMVDLFPGTGAVGVAWAEWRSRVTGMVPDEGLFA